MAEQIQDQTSQWTHTLAYLIAGFIFFETLTGLSIYFLPFNLANQIMVLIHTAVGLIFLIPFGWYQFKHWQAYRARQMTDVKLTGYISMFAVITAIISGLILTWQASFGTGISYLWRDTHIISTFVLLASVLPHILLMVVRDWKADKQVKANLKPRIEAEKSFGFNSLYIVLVQFALVGFFMFMYSSPELDNSFPEGYEFPHGDENPFAPSLARTSTGGAMDASLLSGSESCGSSGCHEQILNEWEASAHRYAAEDPFFRAVQSAMAAEKGAASTRYCAGCHDPISLFAGTKNLHSEELTNKVGLDEGVSCVSCHSITQVDERGNADYEIEPPERYMFELHEGETAKWINDFLIRAYPQQHVDSFDRGMFKSAEYCSSCHKQFIDEQINNVGWVQLQNQYDPWKESHWFTEGSPITTIECRECHMPLVDSFDPASGDEMDYNRTPDDGKHRSHRFLGSNQFVPTLLDLPGAEEHVKQIEKWLRGEIKIPEIADKWETGPAILIQLHAPDSIEVGSELHMEVLMTNNKAGHDFPTGPLDIIQSWIQIIAKDQNGRVVYSSGTLDEDHFIEPGSFIFRAEPVDQYGNPIDRHNLWDMVGVQYSRALFPGRSDYARYSFSIKELDEYGMRESGGENSTGDGEAVINASGDISDIYIEAKLQYRKMNQFLMKEAFEEALGTPTAPVTTLSEDSKHVKVISIES
ncbi:MAG: multiheme c-type cytochrome [Balneolaceae bacterium]